MRIADLPLVFEVRDEYIQLRTDGRSRNEAVAELVQTYMDELTCGADDDGLCFWIGLADGQYKRKELSQEIADRGMAALDRFPSVFYDVTPGDITRRREHYACAPMPERKVIPPRKKFATQWKDGDVFAYQLSGEKAAAIGAEGKYVLLQKITEVSYYDGRILPVLTISVCDMMSASDFSQEFKKRQILRLFCGTYDVPYGLWQYRTVLMIKNEAQLKSASLIYVGNFDIAPMPDDEVVYAPESMLSFFLERINDDLCMYYGFHIFSSTSTPKTEPERWPFWMR